jgi:hypothetical protein
MHRQPSPEWVYLLSIRIRHDARSHVPRSKEVRCSRRDDSLKTLGVHTGTRSSDHHVQGLVGCTFAFAVWFQPLTSALTSPDRAPNHQRCSASALAGGGSNDGWRAGRAAPFLSVRAAISPVSTTGGIVGYMYILVDPIDPNHRWQSKLLTLEEARVQAQALVDDFAAQGESAELVIAEVRVLERMS